MHIEYQISVDDFEAAAWLALRKRSVPGWFRFYYFSGFVMLWVAINFLPMVATRTLRSFIESILGASFGLAMLAFQLLFLKFKFCREYRESTLLHLRTNADIDAIGVHFSTQESDSRSSWQVYSKWSEGKSAFILSPRGNRTFVPIPKRELTPTQITELRSLFETHLPRR